MCCNRVQELLKPEDHEEGRVPRTVECELTQDLVDACIPGDVVTVTGIIRGINTYMDIGGGMPAPACISVHHIWCPVLILAWMLKGKKIEVC